jgi:hypothetical protein
LVGVGGRSITDGLGLRPIRVRFSNSSNQRGNSVTDGATEPFFGFLPGIGGVATISLRKITSRNACRSLSGITSSSILIASVNSYV